MCFFFSVPAKFLRFCSFFFKTVIYIAGLFRNRFYLLQFSVVSDHKLIVRHHYVLFIGESDVVMSLCVVPHRYSLIHFVINKMSVLIVTLI